MLDFFAHRWLDIVLALVFALIADLVRVGSIARGIARQFKNKLAEYSTARLQKRIATLESQKRNWLEYLASDKPVYLETMRYILFVLYFVSAGIAVFGISHAFEGLDPAKDLPIVGGLGAGFLCVLAAVLAMRGATITRRKGKPRNIENFVAQLDSEIAHLRAQLELRSRK
jgi:uncharacterized small protein (DUF1192 family)